MQEAFKKGREQREWLERGELCWCLPFWIKVVRSVWRKVREREGHEGRVLGVPIVAERTFRRTIASAVISAFVGWLFTTIYKGSLELLQGRDIVNSIESHFKMLPWNSLFLTIYTFLVICMLATAMALIRMCGWVKSRREWENTSEMIQKTTHANISPKFTLNVPE